MSLRSHYYQEWAAGRDVSGHDGRPRPVERCAEPSPDVPPDVYHYVPCNTVATTIVTDREGATYAMCDWHAREFQTRMQRLTEQAPIDPRD
jgi:hypothetical protein